MAVATELTRRTAVACAVLSAACGDATTPPAGPASSTATAAPGSIATGSAASPASATPEPSAPPSASAAPGPHEPSVAALIAEAARDPKGVAGRRVAFDVLYVSVSQREFGYSTEHAGGTFTVLHVAFPDAPKETIPCMMPMSMWPPAGALPGTPIHVEGRLSFDRLHNGGTVEGGGPLEIHGCKVTRR